MLAGWRRKEMSCLVGGCNRICSGRYWPAKPETMVLDAAKYAPRVFASEKFALAFFCLPAEFYFAVFGSRCGIPWKDQT